jgi:hypothetical protein
VVALERACERVEPDPEAARALVAPHLGTLERVPEARRIFGEAGVRMAERRAAQARAAVQTACVALTGGRAEEALGLLDDATLRDLPETERGPAERLRAEAARMAARQRRAGEVGRLREAGRLFEARDLSATLAAEAEGEERARWEAERREIQAAIQRAFRVEVDEEPRPFDGGADPLPRLWFDSTVRWLTADGRAFVLVETLGPRVVVNVVEREGLVVRAAVLLRAPAPFPCWWFEVIGRTLWLVSERGAVLALSLDTWDVELFRPSLDPVPGGRLAYLPLLPSVPWTESGSAPRPRFLWVLVESADGRDPDIRVYDLADRRPPRVLPSMLHAMPLPGMPEPRVASLLDDAVVLYEERGTPAPEGSLAVPGKKVLGVTPRPDGRGITALVETAGPGGDERGGIGWVEVPFQGGAATLHPIEGAIADHEVLGRAAEAGAVIASFFTREGALDLLALGPAAAGDTMEPLWRARCPTHRMVLMTDADGRRLVGYELRPGEPLLVELGRTPPDLPPWTFEGRKLSTVMRFKECLRDFVLHATRQTAKLDASTAGALVRKLLRPRNPRPLTIVFAVIRLEALSKAVTAEMTRGLTWLAENHPDFPDFLLLRAERLAAEGRWQEVVDLLAPLASASSVGSQICAYHAHHLTTLAFLHLGDADRARETLGRVGTEPTGCPLEALRDLCSPLPDPLLPEAWGPDRPLLVQLIGAARHADACLQRGDPAAVLAALTRDPFSTCGEVQILARLAEAWLAVPAPERRSRLHKIAALGRFVAAHAERDPVSRRGLLLPGANWDDARLDDVSARASAWLDAEG